MASLGFVTGCGGSDDDDMLVGASSYAGRSYRSTFGLSEGGTAVVTVAVAGDGTATGTATVDNGRSVSRVVVGSGSISGRVDAITGLLNLSGNILLNGVSTPITVGGNRNNVASLGLNGTVYQASWSVFTTPTASPSPGTSPSPAATPSGGGTSNSQGAFSDLQFSAVSGANVTSTGTNLKAVSGAITMQTLPILGSLSTITVADFVNGVARSVTITTLGNLAAGQTIALDGSTNNVIYTEAVQGQTTLPRSFSATGGTVTVNSINGNEYRFTLNNVTLTAGPSPQASSGTGSFTLNGTVTAQK
jgi:hypothetical protein